MACSSVTLEEYRQCLILIVMTLLYAVKLVGNLLIPPFENAMYDGDVHVVNLGAVFNLLMCARKVGVKCNIIYNPSVSSPIQMQTPMWA